MTATDAGSRLTYQDRMAAFVAGYELGRAERHGLDIEDLVQAALHERSLQALGMARRYADTKGPNWAALVCDDDEGAGDE